MAIESTPGRPGWVAADFTLPDTQGVQHDLAGLRGPNGLLLMFICNHCPFVIHIQAAFAQMAAEYQQRGVAVVAINANDVANYPDDSPEKMIEAVREHGYSFPYLFDETQTVARAYDAACTPDFYLFDAQHRLYYRGQFDNARPGNDEPVNGADLRHALDAVLAQQPAPEGQKPSLGCNIKWKAE